MNKKNNHVWSHWKSQKLSAGRVCQICSTHVMLHMSVGVCLETKKWRKGQISASCYINDLLPNLVEDCHDLLGGKFCLPKDGAHAHVAKVMQHWFDEHWPNITDRLLDAKESQELIVFKPARLLCVCWAKLNVKLRPLLSWRSADGRGYSSW